jgi:hypothetical protein
MEGKRGKGKIPYIFIGVSLFLLVSIMGSLMLMDNFRRVQREDEIRTMARLITARQTYREVIYSRKTIFIVDKRVLFAADFTVEAGVDLEKCRLSRDRKGRMTLYLPPVEIFRIDCDETSINQFYFKEQFSTLRYSDYSAIIEEEKESIREELRQSDLIERAQNNARLILKEMWAEGYQSDIQLTFLPSLEEESFGE